MTTTMHRVTWSRAVASCLTFALTLVACAPVAGPVDVEAAVVGDDGAYTLETVTLETVVDLHRGVGSLFDVRAGAGFDLVSAVTSGVLEGDEMSALESAESDAVHEGWEVHPQLHWDFFGQRFVADDMDTLLYLTVQKNFESVWIFYRDVIGDTSRATTRKTFVALYSDVYLSDTVPLPLPIIPKNDNAAFHPLFDYFLVMRVNDQDGIPLGMHEGITAHEFQHRVHHWNMSAHETVFPAWKRASTGKGAQLARAVDEGLADIFALGFTGGDPAFLASALVDPPLSFTAAAGLGLEMQASLRDLDGEYARNLTWEEIEEGASDELIRAFCGSLRTLDEGADPLEGVVIAFNPYCLGTLIARTLYETADEDVARLVDDVLPAVHRSLPVLAERIARAIDETGDYDYQIPWALEAFAGALDDDRRARFCSVVRARFAPLVDAGEITVCP